MVAVDDPYKHAVPGERPPLAPGMFCEVELRAKPRSNQVVVPRTVIRNRHVYVLNKENRLESRQVEIAFAQGGFASIKSGLTPGERLVVSDPTPAVEGMLVEPTLDETLLQSLIAEAEGEVPLQ